MVKRRSSNYKTSSIAMIKSPSPHTEPPPRRRRSFLTAIAGVACVLLILSAIIVYFVRFHPGHRWFAPWLLHERKIDVYTYEIVNEFDHDPNAFTQGLVYGGNDTLYESTGMYGESSVRTVQLQTGKVRQQHQIARNYFGEGLAAMDRRLFQLTWKTNLGFIFDEETLNLSSTFRHPMKDGWGLATDGEYLIGSDGSATLYFMNRTTFAAQKRVIVRYDDEEVTFLNELEYVKNEVWANVWMSNCIARISPKDGNVLGWILLHNLRRNLIASGYKKLDVLNGIAWDEDGDRLFVTGKWWPKLYEIRLHPYSQNLDNLSVRKMCLVQQFN